MINKFTSYSEATDTVGDNGIQGACSLRILRNRELVIVTNDMDDVPCFDGMQANALVSSDARRDKEAVIVF